MATLDRDDITALARELRESSGGGNPSAGTNSQDNRNYKERMDDLIKSSKEAGDSFKKLNGGLRLTSRAQYEHRTAMKEASDELYELEKALTAHRRGTNLLNDAQLKAVEARRKELSGMMQQSQAGEKLIGVLGQAGKFLIGYYTAVQQATLQGIGQVLSTIQAGGSGFAIANAQMAMQLDIANTHVQQLASGAQMAGGAIAMIPGVASKVVGLGVMLSAEAKKATSQLKTDAQKMYNNLLMAGGDQLLKSFENLTRSGAVLANGADGIRNALAVGGTMQISFQTFEKMLAGNTELLANSNMGMAAASEMLAKVGSKLKSQGVDKGLQALGIGMEETGAIIATVMRDIARRGRTPGQAEVEVQTVEYAKNLALMASLSGKSVKEELAKRQAAQSEFGYRAKMLQLGDRANKEQATVMEGLTASTRAAIVEQATYGHIRNEQARQQAQLMPEFNEYIVDMARDFESGRLDIKRELELRGKMGPALENSMKNNPLLTQLAVARGKLESPLNAFMEEFDRTMRSNATTVEKQMTIIEGQYLKGLQAKLDDQGSLTAVLLSMKSIGEEFQAKFQDEIITKIPKIAQLLKKALDDAEALIKSGPKVNTGEIEAIGGLADKAIILGAALMALTYGFKAIRSLINVISPPKAPTTTTTETAKTAEAAKAQEQSRLSKLKEKITPKQPGNFSSAANIARMELGLSGNATKAEIDAARAAKFTAKYGKYIKGAGGLAIAAQGYENYSNADKIREAEKRGEIDAKTANAKVTAEAFDFAGAIASSAAGGKIGAVVGTAVGAAFFGVGAPFGAIIGGLLGAIGGGLMYYLTPLQTWTKKIGEGFSKWWQSWTFKGVWDSIGKGLGSAMTVVSDWADGAYKTVTGWFNFGDKPRQPPTQTVKNDGTPSVTAAATLPAVTGKIPDGLKLMSNGGLGVSLMQGGNLVTLGTEGKAAFLEVFRNAQGGAGSMRTTGPSTLGFYDVKTKTGKAVTEADFAEIGKGDPVVYALGKLTKIAAEEVDVMRSLATKMGASLDTQSDSKRYLRNMAGAFR